MTISRFLAGLELLAYGCVIIGAILDQPFVSGGSLACIIIYALTASVCCKHSRTAQMYADKTYFLGYLCTIIGFAAIGVRVGRDPHLLEKPDKLLYFGGFALGSTITGLYLMNRLKETAERLLRKEPNADGLDKVLEFFANFEKRLERSETSRVETMIKLFTSSDFAKTLNKVGADLQMGSKSLEELRRVSETSVSVGQKLTNVLSKLDSQMDHVSSAYEKCAPKLDALSGTVDEIEEVHQTISDLAEKLKIAVSVLATTIGSLTDIVVRCGTGAESFSKNLSTMTDLKIVNNQLLELNKSVSAFLRTISENGELLVKFSNQVQNIDSFGSTVDKAAENLKKLNQGLENGCGFNQQFITSVQDLESVIEEFVKLSKQKLRA